MRGRGRVPYSLLPTEATTTGVPRSVPSRRRWRVPRWVPPRRRWMGYRCPGFPSATTTTREPRWWAPVSGWMDPRDGWCRREPPRSRRPRGTAPGTSAWWVDRPRKTSPRRRGGAGRSSGRTNQGSPRRTRTTRAHLRVRIAADRGRRGLRESSGGRSRSRSSRLRSVFAPDRVPRLRRRSASVPGPARRWHRSGNPSSRFVDCWWW
mmetsp:Transcript_25988/g.61018  ORF Transcript_25988/g.61018 Transcript_25988/m.61018 type:complete len:207 (-) Transcript_25988:196-816(-)